MAMGPYVDSIIPDEILPASTQVVVIGGGIIGTSAALTLAIQGVPVVLCEKAYIGCEQSSRNWGWCRQAGRDEREMPLIVQSLQLWRTMNETTELDTGFRESGVLFVAESEADEIRLSAWIDMAKPYEVRGARLVRGGELATLMPGASRAYPCGLHVPGDGRAEPQRTVPAIARAAQRKGATVMTQCAVRGFERSAGRISAVITERGRIACEAVILAGGAWTSLFCASLGVRLPQLKVLSSVMRTAPVAGPETNTYLHDVGYRKRGDGGYTLAKGAGYVAPVVPDSFRFLREFMPTVRNERESMRLRINAQSLRELRTPRRWALDRPSPFERTRVLDPAPNLTLNGECLAAMIKLYPQFANVHIVQQWAGYIDVTPDVVPYISPVETVPGLTVATGFSGHGFGIGPAAGRLAAEIAIQLPLSVDPTAFRATRFSDGSPILLGAGV